jgi:hypothetical protein
VTLAELTQNDEVAKRLCSVPSVSPATEMYFVAVIDSRERRGR